MSRRSRRPTALIVLAGLVLVAVALALISPWSGGRASSRARGEPSQSRARAAVARNTTHQRVTARPPRRTPSLEPSPGSLPQTHVLPSGGDARFHALMAALWRGVSTNSLNAALPAFFPRAAYVRLKAIPSAASDWSDRLVHEYGLDIAAAHALLGPAAGGARLLRVSVPSSYAHWVEPGACYNGIGYYEVPNARVVYRDGRGAIRSFGIASLISWRGVWYVVHLGSVLRGGEDAGRVDEPAAGAGNPAYSGTC